MTRFLRSLLACLVLLSSPLAASAETDLKTAESLVRASGLWSQLGDFAPQIHGGILEGLAATGVRPKAVDMERLSHSIDRAYGAERFRSTVISRLARDLDQTHVAALGDWYAGPVGQAMTALEEAMSADQRDPRLIMREGNALLPKFSSTRRELIERLIVVTKAVESAVEITMDSAVAVQRGVACALPDLPTPSAKDLRERLGSQREELMQTFASMYLAMYAKAYADVAEPDLARYVDFLQSEAGSHYGAVVLDALRAAFGEAADTMARCVPASKGGVSL